MSNEIRDLNLRESDEWQNAISAAIDYVSSGKDDDSRLINVIQGLPCEIKDHIVYTALIDAGRVRHRLEAKNNERAVAKLHRGACSCERCVIIRKSRIEIKELEDEKRMRLTETIEAWVRDYSSELRMEWNAAILNSKFTRHNGELVTWGRATIEDHQDRIAMFSTNALTNLEGAARHAAAIAEIKRGNATCLGDLIKVAA